MAVMELATYNIYPFDNDDWKAQVAFVMFLAMDGKSKVTICCCDDKGEQYDEPDGMLVIESIKPYVTPEIVEKKLTALIESLQGKYHFVQVWIDREWN